MKACHPVCDRAHHHHIGRRAPNPLKWRLQGACAPVSSALHGGKRRRVAGGAKRPQGRARRSRFWAAGPSVPASHSPSSRVIPLSLIHSQMIRLSR